ncbi:MAG: DUF4430 domain-containing protein [Dehalococcoidales bacterium]|nr:DUF4430 domain-containing protein [Dehalococcoidales bacterium]
MRSVIICPPVVRLAALFLVAGSLAALSLSGCHENQEAAPKIGPVEPENAVSPSQAQPESNSFGSPAPANGSNDESEILLVVTRDFGSEIMIEETVPIGKNTTAMEVLMAVAEVDTAYGGGFVNAINGLASDYTGSNESKGDWFIYFNGMSSKVGALDYTLFPGDVEHWDYRNWDFHQFVPAIVGDFPEPFMHGHGGTVYPTVVVYQEGWEEAAADVAGALSSRGVAGVSTCSSAELGPGDRETANIILVGTADFPLIEELNGPWNRLGFYCYFEDDTLEIFDGAGEMTGEYAPGDGAGLIQATQSIWNPDGIGVCENVIWMVTGTDELGVEAAVDIMVNSSDAFDYACAIVIVDGEMVKVP